MSGEMVIYGAERCIATTKGKNYSIALPNAEEIGLKRGVDFGVIPKTKKPTLYKSGAEKICLAYGLLQRYEIESMVENTGGKEAFFHYLFKCSLVKIAANGQEYVFTTGYGSANTAEKRNGFNGAYDAANNAVKMAQKRALVAAAISISGLSDMFTQDMENEDFMNNAQSLIETDKPESPVNANQIKRLYAIGGELGMNAAAVKQRLAALGYTSTKQILQKDYNNVIEEIRKAG